MVTTYAQAPCLHARQRSFVYIWVTCHRGIQGLEDRLWLSVIRLLCWALFLRIPGLWHEGSLYLHSTGWHMDNSYQAVCVCVFPARCVWSLFAESPVLPLSIYVFLLSEKSSPGILKGLLCRHISAQYLLSQFSVLVAIVPPIHFLVGPPLTLT